MAERPQHDRQGPRAVEVRDQQGRLVEGQQGVGPDVAFGVPLGVLGRVGQGQQLGRHAAQQVPLAQQAEAEGGARGLQQQLLDLAEDALGRQLVERHRGAQAGRGRLDLELEAGRQLHRPQGAQRVVAEGGRVHGPQAAPLEVGPAAPRVDQRLGLRVVEQRVDREVPAARGLLDGEVRVAQGADAAVARPGLRVAPRQRHVDGARQAGEAADLEHGEGLPNRVHRSEGLEQRGQGLAGQAVDLDVEVLARPAQQRVAHGPTDHVRPPARLPQDREQPLEAGRQGQFHAAASGPSGSQRSREARLTLRAPGPARARRRAA